MSLVPRTRGKRSASQAPLPIAIMLAARGLFGAIERAGREGCAMTSTATINRRDFLKETAAGLTLALTVSADPAAIIDAAAADAPLAANLWVTIATDGTITIVSPPAEMGQGTFTALAAVLADE